MFNRMCVRVCVCVCVCDNVHLWRIECVVTGKKYVSPEGGLGGPGAAYICSTMSSTSARMRTDIAHRTPEFARDASRNCIAVVFHIQLESTVTLPPERKKKRVSTKKQRELRTFVLQSLDLCRETGKRER